MRPLRLRTQLFITTLLIIVTLTGTLLLTLRHFVRNEAAAQVQQGTQDSLQAFNIVQKQRERELVRTTALLAELPTLKAQMTTQDPLTIQDGSESFWKLMGSDLFVLANSNKQVMALYTAKAGITREAAERNLRRSLDAGTEASWWYDAGRLYWVFLRPISAGAGNTWQPLGLLAVGYEVDASVAQQLAIASGNQIVLTTGHDVVAATLPEADQTALQELLRADRLPLSDMDAALTTDHYAFSSVLLSGDDPLPVRCYVLMPLAPVNLAMNRLNRTIFILGGSAVVLGGLLFGFVASTVTRPLDNLVAGVHALAGGDFTYSIAASGSIEVSELSESFADMRAQLLVSQKQRMEAGRLAALATAASSISHDLRHYLATVVANAEFLYEAEQLNLNKKEIYEEIQNASQQMTDLLDSFRELASPRGSISREPVNLGQVLRRAMETIHARAEFRDAHIVLRAEDELDGMLDPRKLERVFFNLLLNACEAASGRTGEITVEAQADENQFIVRVRDNGSGVPAVIRDTLFEPFVSCGKVNGTGMGLAIVSKIVRDHGGEAAVESSTSEGTSLLIRLPRIKTLVVASPPRSTPEI
jgi:signal transduction histidine kinase